VRSKPLARASASMHNDPWWPLSAICIFHAAGAMLVSGAEIGWMHPHANVASRIPPKPVNVVVFVETVSTTRVVRLSSRLKDEALLARCQEPPLHFRRALPEQPLVAGLA